MSYRKMSGPEGQGEGDPMATESTHLLRAERDLFHSLRGDRSLDAPDSEDFQEQQLLEDSVDGPSDGLDGSKPTSPSSTARTLNTFEGVFAPVSLSMLSSLLFLRVGYIVGNAGLWETVLQFGIAYVILVSTVLSICAIATNGAVEGGGVYYMLSRTLGIEFGGAIGVLFWFANLVSSALYLSACAEGIIGSFGPDGAVAEILLGGPWSHFLYASIINAVNLSVCLLGSKLFGRTNSLVLTVVVACTLVTVISFFPNFEYSNNFVYNATKDCVPPTDNVSLPNCTKSVEGTFTGLLASSGPKVHELLKANLDPKYEYDCSDGLLEVDFFVVFGVLFSGVTGIMSGANMSGELVSPGKSIPRGTISACLFTFTIFIALSVFTAMTCDPNLLQHDCMYMSDFSIWSGNVAIGIFLATFSASLNNLIGASRVVEAVAKDVMFGPMLAFITKGTLKDNPVAAVVFSWIMVEGFLLMGSLNVIAQLSSVLFLLSYATCNLACLGLHVASAPNFRPAFKYFSWHTCLVGLIGTTFMMFMVSPVFSAVSILLCLSLIFALNFFSPIRKQNWGSISQALLFHQVRKYLLMLDPRKAHVKFWRPQMLLLVENPRTCCSLIDFVNALKKGGLYVIGHVYVDQLKNVDRDPCVVQHNHWLSLVDHLKIKAFVELTMASSLREGIQHLVRISGIGAMKPNTIVMGFYDETFHGDDFMSPYSPFSTNQFEGIFPDIKQKQTESESATVSMDEDQLTESRGEHRFSKQEYVGTLCDILKMRKNMCICRHFQQLDKGTLFRPDRESIFGTRAKRKLYLDVWLVDFFSPEETDISDTTSLFLLQLACIVNMVPRWKKLTLRVFIMLKNKSAEGQVIQSQEELVRHMLELLRIRAKATVLPWIPEAPHDEKTPRALSERMSSAYLKSANECVRRRSADTAVTFLYLPAPPKEEWEHPFYLDCLTSLTKHWPPTLLVNGVSPVTSITL